MEAIHNLEKSLFKQPFQEAIYYIKNKYQNQMKSIKLSDLENILIKENSTIHLLGFNYIPEKDIKKNLDIIENLKSMLKKMKKFTYYRKFKYNNQMVNDVGWSCTIRSGQMLLINLIVRNKMKKNREIKDSEILKNKKNRDIKDWEILKYFLYENELSLCNILKNGELNFGKRIKEQWSQKEFFETCCKILKNDDFLKKNLGNEKKEYIFDDEKRFEIVNSDGILIKEKLLSILNKKNGVLIILNLQLGFGKIDNKNEKFLFDMLKSKFFSGAVAGRKNKAYFVCGLIKDQILYLDPHKIRNNEDTSSFKISELNFIKYKNLHPSFCVGIFLENEKDLKDFSSFVKNLNSDFVQVYNEDEIENLSMNEIDIFQNQDKNSEIFENLENNKKKNIDDSEINKEKNIDDSENIIDKEKNLNYQTTKKIEKKKSFQKNKKNIENTNTLDYKNKKKIKKDKNFGINTDFTIKTNFEETLRKKVLKKQTNKIKVNFEPKKNSTNNSQLDKNSYSEKDKKTKKIFSTDFFQNEKKSKDSDIEIRKRKQSDMSFQIIEENSDKTISVQNSRSSFHIQKNKNLIIKENRKKSDSDIKVGPVHRASFISLKSDKDIILEKGVKDRGTKDFIKEQEDEFFTIND